MDYLHLESSDLSFGWHDPTSSMGIDGSSNAIDNDLYQTNTASGGYYGSEHHIARLPTPLDPLLKHLKKTYASSAGPQDVMGCAVSKENLDRWLNAAIIGPSNVAPMEKKGHEDEGGLSSPQWAARQTYDATLSAVGVGSEGVIPYQMGVFGTVLEQHASPSLFPSQQPNISILGDITIPPLPVNRKPKRRMPDFCYAPTTHVENLLRTTPHLRHLSAEPTDMSGVENYGESKNFFHKLFKGAQSNIAGFDSPSSASPDIRTDYGTSVLRQRANRRASLELASFLRTLSNEMPHDKFVAVESEVYSKLFSLVHSKTVRADERLAGVSALDALLSVPSFDQDKKAIRFGNNLSNGLKAAVPADYEFLHAVARALGKMASSAANVDRVEFEIGRSLEWLRSDRSDRRLTAVLVLRELAQEAPAAFYSKTDNAANGLGAFKDGGLLAGLGDLGLGGTNEFLDHIFPVLRDDQLIVRVCAADALSECIKILMERQPHSMTAPLCTLYSNMISGLRCDEKDNPSVSCKVPLNIQSKDDAGPVATPALNHGSLLVVGTFLDHTKNFIMPRFDEVCVAVLNFMDNPFALLRLEVVRLIPRLAQRCPGVYGMRYLERSLDFLISIAAVIPQPKGVDMRPTAFTSIGLLAMAMCNEEMPQVTIASTNNLLLDGVTREGAYHMVELKETSDFQSRMDDIMLLISENLRKCSAPGSVKPYTPVKSYFDVLGCLANMVEAFDELSAPYIPELIEDLFQCGLSESLIKCLQSICKSFPPEQLNIKRRLLNEISFCLTGSKSLDIISDLFTDQGNINVRPPLTFIKESSLAAIYSPSSLPAPPSLNKNFLSSMSLSSINPRPKKATQPELTYPETEPQLSTKARVDTQVNSDVVINTANRPDAVYQLVLSLRTLRAIGTSYLRANNSDGNNNMLLPFLQKVISRYLAHPANEVRQEAAVTCCMLLLPPRHGRSIGQRDVSLLIFGLSSESASIMEEVLQNLLQVAASDSSPAVRLCVVRGLDERYDSYLCQLNLLSPLFLMLEDEALAVRACTLQILCRLARLNPALILPVLRKVLIELIIELSCTAGNSNGRESSTRLLVVFLHEDSLFRLVRPVVSSIIDSLPLSNVAPRLVSVSLEALGELATVSHTSIKPWLQQLVPVILNNMQDQNSSKQCVSLSTMGKIAFGTGYVIRPYIDYPQLLTQASDLLPTTKRAPWELRREVFRLFGILGALDPDRLGSSSYKARRGGVGGGYFVDSEEEDNLLLSKQHVSAIPSSPKRGASKNYDSSLSPIMFSGRNISSSVPEFHSTSDSNKLQTTADGISHKSSYKSSDNDEPAHLYMYEQYAMTSQPLSVIATQRRLVPSDDDFYPTVAISALMRILNNQSLSNLHAMVMKAVMFIFNALGMQSVPFLKQIVPHILSTIKSSDQPGIREALLQQLTSLSSIVREHIRPYLASIFDVVEQFWFSSRHLGSLCTLVERVATAVPDDVRDYIPLLVRLILASIEEVDTSGWSNTTASSEERLVTLLKFTRQCQRHEFFHLLIPALVRFTELLVNPEPDGKERKIHISPPNNSSRSSIAVETILTISLLLQSLEINTSSFVDSSFPARVVQPFLRMLSGEVLPNKAVGTTMIECICICARQLGPGRWLSFYHSIAKGTIESWQTKVGIERVILAAEDGVAGDTIRSQVSSPADFYDEVISEMMTNSSARSGLWMTIEEDGSRSEFSIEPSRASEVSLAGMVERLRTKETPNPPFTQSVINAAITQRSINVEKLQKSWDVSQRTSREDYDEWMRRFSIQLLQEAPSAALRACAELAASYPPLARELFSSAFVCCWMELNQNSRTNLVDSLQKVFASEASLEILQLLLNLAEFMEHDVDNKSKSGLPIKIGVLAELAIKCRAYSKALHYKELEYIQERSSCCVEQLIDINKKLDLPEAALGVLKAAKIELERRGAQSVSAHYRTNSGDTKNLAYSVVNNYYADKTTTANELNSWAGNIMYESWLTKLGAWSEAVAIYEQKLLENPYDVNSILGCMHCYDARGDWQRALNLAEISWRAIEQNTVSYQHRQHALKLCAQASWRLSKWELLETYTSQLVQVSDEGKTTEDVSASRESNANDFELDFDSYYYRSVLHVHRGEWQQAAKSIDSARKAMDSRFTTLLSESYKRAYPSMVSAQCLSELEEIICYRQLELRTSQLYCKHVANRPDEKEARDHLLDVWRCRLDGCRVDAEAHSSILAVRSLILGPTDEVDATITLAALSRQAAAVRLAERTLLDPLERMGCNLTCGKVFGFDLPSTLQLGLFSSGFDLELVVKGEMAVRQPYGKVHEVYYNQLLNEAGGKERLFCQHKLYFAYIKHLWATERRDESIARLRLLCNVVELAAHYESQQPDINSLRVRCWLKYGEWKLALNPPGDPLSETLAAEVISSYKRATDSLTHDYRAWHSWALINFRLAEQIHGSDKEQSSKKDDEALAMLQNHVIAAVKAFVLAISIGTKRWSASVQQDMLNLLSCLFKYGELPGVSKTINDGLGSIKIEAWLGVLPQLLARIHMKSKSIRSVLHPLLVRLGAKHPQALMYPLSVLLKSPVLERKVAAESLMNSLKAHSNALVEEARMVSSELIRVAILWLELWHEGLEDASRLYYGEGNVSGMLDVLLPLHQQLEKGASTRREEDFLKSFGRDLSEAHCHIKDYVRLITSSGQTIPVRGGFMAEGAHTAPANREAEAALNAAWDLYYTVFRRINKQLPGMTTLELDQCSPALYNAKKLELSVPGTYSVDGSYVKIERFVTSVQVITSKQRPRKIVIRGNDGKDYVFLLKGHEDLRQDERVMQLFGLVNALLARDRRTNKHDLNIQRYAIAPLSHNAGVVGWVPHCDTLHCLIRDYREGNKIPLNSENREMMALAPNYDSLTAMQKVEIFTEALARTKGQGNDLYEVLWTKSTNSEEWLERRTNFTRSLAVMSMVGYILGLGDRHPSNLMLDQVSGRVLHIDFGDCFEVAMHREKFPEKVPFRLTRMLTRAMEVSGIEGSYRSTCEKTMSVLRDNKDSLVAMLEAFVYDPLISWRLLDQSSGESMEEIESRSLTPGGQGSSRTKEAQNVSLHNASVSAVHTTIPESIHEGQEEDEEDDEGDDEKDASEDGSNYSQTDESGIDIVPLSVKPSESSQHAKSLQMYSEMKALAANLSTSSRIQSLTGSAIDPTRSRADKSVRQRELLSFIGREDGDANNDEALNEKALKVIRRVQDKLTGTDFHCLDEVTEPLDVSEQVQRLIVQATSSENLCQLFIGWCAFW